MGQVRKFNDTYHYGNFTQKLTEGLRQIFNKLYEDHLHHKNIYMELTLQ